MVKGSEESWATDTAGGAQCWWWFCLLMEDPDWLLFRLSHDDDDEKKDVGGSSTNFMNVITTLTVGTTGIATLTEKVLGGNLVVSNSLILLTPFTFFAKMSNNGSSSSVFNGN
ncbi:hypothetical protein ACFX13_030909 [Malus domestica]